MKRDTSPNNKRIEPAAGGLSGVRRLELGTQRISKPNMKSSSQTCLDGKGNCFQGLGAAKK
jgi:hypothetical protein